MNYRKHKISEKASDPNKKVARLYRRKDSKIKDALSFRTPNSTKLV
jgi:hypothetical protein